MNYRVDREESDQQALIYWVRTQEILHPELKLLHHIPNGGYRSKTTAVRMKRLGVRRGVPDLCLPVPKQASVEKDGVRYTIRYPGLYIEMKAPEGKTSKDQEEFIDELRFRGYCCEVCYSYEEARALIEKYIKLQDMEWCEKEE